MVGGCRLYPHLQNLNLKYTDVDTMNLDVLLYLFVSTFQEFCCLYCAVNIFAMHLC